MAWAILIARKTDGMSADANIKCCVLMVREFDVILGWRDTFTGNRHGIFKKLLYSCSELYVK